MPRNLKSFFKKEPYLIHSFLQSTITRNLIHRGHRHSGPLCPNWEVVDGDVNPILRQAWHPGYRDEWHAAPGLASQALPEATQDRRGQDQHFKGSDRLQGFSATTSLNPCGNCKDLLVCFLSLGLSPRLQTRMNMNAPPGTVLRILAVFSHPPQDSLIFISAFL